jgi:D-glycero-alpha-D-manno-heptose-7-phosphate kinase
LIYTQTPFRLSFFGGGTDYKPFFEQYNGSVLSTTFNKYVYTTLRRCPPFFDYHTAVRYKINEEVRFTEELKHPLIRNCMIFTNTHNLSVNYDADLPARSGLGSSSAFGVGLLQSMYAFQGKYVSKQKLAQEVIHVERVLCAEDGGWQDQIAAAYGGFNRIDFNADGFSVRPVIISPQRKKELNDHLMMFFTGIARDSAEVAKAQTESIKDKTAQLLEMKKLVDDAMKILVGSQTSKSSGGDIIEFGGVQSYGDIRDFGRLLDYTWQLKRGLTSVITTEFIDNIYAKAKANGAIGGKLMGAGGGGFMVLFAEPDAQAGIREALSEFVYVPFEFESDGSKIIHYTPEEYDYYERSH